MPIGNRFVGPLFGTLLLVCLMPTFAARHGRHRLRRHDKGHAKQLPQRDVAKPQHAYHPKWSKLLDEGAEFCAAGPGPICGCGMYGLSPGQCYNCEDSPQACDVCPETTTVEGVEVCNWSKKCSKCTQLGVDPPRPSVGGQSGRKRAAVAAVITRYTSAGNSSTFRDSLILLLESIRDVAAR